MSILNLAQQKWPFRAAIGALLGAVLFVVVPPLIGKKDVCGEGGSGEIVSIWSGRGPFSVKITGGGDGGTAYVGGKGLAVDGTAGKVSGTACGQGGAGGAASVGGNGIAIGGSGGDVTGR